MEPQVNRRRWQRYPFDASVRVVVVVDPASVDHPLVDHSPEDHSPETTVVDGRGVHFSEGGICLFAANLPVGSQVKVEFRTPIPMSRSGCGKVTAASIYTASNFSPTNLKTANNWRA